MYWYILHASKYKALQGFFSDIFRRVLIEMLCTHLLGIYFDILNIFIDSKHVFRYEKCVLNINNGSHALITFVLFSNHNNNNITQLYSALACGTQSDVTPNK